MKITIKYFLLGLAIVIASSCDLDQLDNPSSLQPKASNPDFVANQIQVAFPAVFQDLSQYGMEVTRILPAIGGNTYSNMYQPTTFDNIWTNSYRALLENAKLLETLAGPRKLTYHLGISQVLQAYVMASLVDVFGDVPYTKALDPTNLNPSVDPGLSTYQAALALLDNAIENFSTNPPSYPQDLYYGGGASSGPKWIAAANTIKLKMWLNLRLTNPTGASSFISSLVNNAALGTPDPKLNFIDNAAEDFVFRYAANSFDNPDTYHPYYKPNYQNGAGQYMANFFMNYIMNGKSQADPRRRFYFYRQTLSVPTDPNILTCNSGGNPVPPSWYPSGMTYCSVPNFAGYFGRDFGDNSGINPDTKLRTAYGLYPVGGKFDEGTAAALSVTSGAKGNGIHPILLSSFTSFMLAEAALTLGTPGNPRTLTLNGTLQSIDKVVSFRTAEAGITGNSLIPSTTSINNFVNTITGNVYDAASDKLNVVATEYWAALFGSGMESYNLYRRTGRPLNMQPTVLTNAPGKFYRSFFYPSVFVNRNSSASQKSDGSVRVFWDNNPDGFIN